VIPRLWIGALLIFFRTSGDISASWGSMFNNLQTTIKFQDVSHPLSRPGCWAYPDMLEVGNLANFNEDRAHFGAWVIVSAPLILGYNLTDKATTDRVWPIITNTEALAISQTWAGHPGMLLQSWNPGPPANVLYLWAIDCNANDPTQVKYTYDSATKTITYSGNGGLCLDYTSASELTAQKCGSSANQQFTYDSTSKTLKADNGQCVDINNFQGPAVELWSCNGGCNQQWKFNADGTLSDSCSGGNPLRCVSAKNNSPFSGSTLQLWGKPQLKSAWGTLLLNNDPVNPYTVDIDLSLYNFTGKVTVRDIWNRKDLGTFQTTFTTDSVAGHDSRLYLITPVST